MMIYNKIIKKQVDSKMKKIKFKKYNNKKR